MSTLGVVHLVFAVLAILTGAVVLLLPKGTRWHRTVGHLYVASMLGVIVTAFSIYRLFGGFGVFHLAAVAALVTIVPGMAFVLLRRPRSSWLERHAGWMAGSYIGLMAAFAAETTTRWIMPAVAPHLPPAWRVPLFWGMVIVASAAVGFAGAWMAQRYLPGSIAATPEAMRRERRALREDPGHPSRARSREARAAEDS